VSTEPARITARNDESSIYRAPVVGHYLRDARDFCDELRPTPDDPPQVVVGKNVIRYGTVAAVGVGAAAVAAIVCL
jgi:hypothetical protein